MICNNRIVITKVAFCEKEQEVFLYLDSNNHPIEIHTNALDAPSLVGNIYIARVSQVMEQINAAFLQAGDLKFFYPIEEFDTILFTKKCGNEYSLCQGDELLVQVVRDAIKTKEICVSTNLSFPGTHVVLTTGKSKHGVSKKITGEKREELKNYVSSLTDREYGIVVRTKASEIELSELRAEIDELDKVYERFKEQIVHKTAGQLVSSAPHPFIAHLERLYSDKIDEVVTDSDEWFQMLQKTYGVFIPVRKYEDESYSMEKLYSIQEMLSSALNKKVFLPSGGYLLIEPTETLTVIDVNSGKNVKKKNKREYYLSNNKEAAVEVARQLRLRNISGMILVDFINMTESEDMEELLRYMRKLVKEDYVNVKVLDITKLGLMEITRAKKYKMLGET